jgi:putative pyruvate formate lyase activating enzyme
MKDGHEDRGVASLFESLKSCVLCPHVCGKDRTAGERGFCGLDQTMVVSSALPHHGEEPPLSGSRGAGTIFFSSCNLRCIYCQNYQISHRVEGRPVSVESLAEIMLELADAGCHNIEPVTPTPHLPGIMAAYLLARKRGLELPLVYNCGGYERAEIVRLLAGMVDIYLPDFKYGSEAAGRRYSRARDYPARAIEALIEMVRQVGDGLEVENGIAKRGILIRHLVLPGQVDSSIDALRMIRKGVSASVPLSLMAQYTPTPAVRRDPLLGRRITRREYERVVDAALDMGFEELYTQEVDERDLVPDFDREEPFDWGEGR